MYHAIVRRKAHRAFSQLSAGDCSEVVASFRKDGVFAFSGEHALGGEFRGPDAVQRWFERTFRVLVGLTFAPRTLVACGPPWNTVVTTHLEVSATLADGSRYQNEALQLLRLRWGKVVEDRIFEDTQRLAEALARQARGGIAEAAAAPLSAT